MRKIIVLSLLVIGSSAWASEVVYQAPKTWVKETAASAMRKAQFRLPGAKDSGDGVLAVFFFPGTGGSVEANLERWYKQFRTPDGKPVVAPSEKKETKVGSLEVTEVSLTGTYLESRSPMMMGGPVDEKPGYALWAAIVETPDGPWFFKATGPAKTIQTKRPEFAAFVKTFKLGN